MSLRLALAIALAVSALGLDASAQQRGRGYGGYNGYSGITVYEHPDFRGESVTFRNEVADLREHGLNDQISSIEVDGNQAWEVCRDVHFGGGCRVFQGTIDDLRSQGWNDRISSMRAVGFVRGNSNRGGVWGNQQRQRRLRADAPGVLRSHELPRRFTRCAQQRGQPGIRGHSRPQRAGVWRRLGAVRRRVPQRALRDGQREHS